MVLGPKPKNRKSTSVKVSYVIHLEEIKPWPPSQSLRTVRSTQIQCEHNDKNFGSTNPVVPSIGSGSGVGDGKIEFSESFRVTVTLSKMQGENSFQKNCLEFNLYELRRDKTIKGQLLGTAIVDLSDYGVVKNSLSISAPLNCKRAFSNAVQPLLFLKIQPVQKNGSESVSALAEETETGLFTDNEDNISSHSQRTTSSEFCDQSVIVQSSDSGTCLRIEDMQDEDVTVQNVAEINFKRAESVRSPVDLIRASKVSHNGAEREVKEMKNVVSDRKIGELENKIMILEGELREAAANEASIYSVVAEHGSSINKVHSPARRLSRLYLHACKQHCSSSITAGAATSALSGLVLVSKACGNDIPRLTFWLSNCIVLRAIILEAIKEEKFPRKETMIKPLNRSSNELEKPHEFISALEKIESWIFSRIVESIWWQAFTPHMQLYEMESSNLKEQEQANFSLQLWKKAFSDACERVCPVRAGGHECGCLPMLPRLIMMQCVARLDVAMFNAILRESGEEIPTDPVSDPISDAKVLPFPPGELSFGAGAQLKNYIGNLSRWLTDLFGHGDEDGDDERQENDSFFKSFHLLNALSDLVMLPKDMLLSRSVRKEVCPAFGAPLLKIILKIFVPDEFSPDPIPDAVIETLHAEEPSETHEDIVTSFPCNAAPIVYMPPSGELLHKIVGSSESRTKLRRNGSSAIRITYTSDDELDELDSPLMSILGNSRPRNSRWSLDKNGRQSARRYQLLREVWTNNV